MESPVRTAERLQIDEALSFYTSGLDEHDPELLVQAFHVDAHMALDGHTYIGDAALRAAANSMWEELASTTHVTSNYRIEFTGVDAADGIGCGTAVSLAHDGSAEFASGTYVDRWERREHQWRMASREVRLRQRLRQDVCACQSSDAATGHVTAK